MESTIEQVLQQAISAHREGRLEDAERLYRAILRSQPLHSDANHNLGVLAVSINKSDAALPLFRAALEANPEVEQFWLSYIDALIKEKQFENAKQLLEQGKRRGLAGEKFNDLEAQLTPPHATKSADNTNPPQELLNNLLDHHYNGRSIEAEKIATSITREFPENQLAWKVLGALFSQTGRYSEALKVIRKAIALSPQDAEAHYNLGSTLQVLGKLEDAEASYIEAVTLQPDFPLAYYNLGIILQQLARSKEAKTNYEYAISFKPDFPEAHNNLGNVLKDMGKLDDAQESWRRAIMLNPRFAQAHFNLANTLQELDKREEAVASYRMAITLSPDFAQAYFGLGASLQKLGNLAEAVSCYGNAVRLDSDFFEAHNNLGNTLKELGKLEEAKASYKNAITKNPRFAEAHYNLGNTLHLMGRLEDAEASYVQSVLLAPNFTEAHKDLGVTRKELGKLNEARTSLIQAIAVQPDYSEAIMHLSMVLNYMDNLEAANTELQRVLQKDEDRHGLRAGVLLAIHSFLKGNFTESKTLLLEASNIQEKSSLEYRNEKVYQSYLLKIIDWHQHKAADCLSLPENKKLYVIGESHSLANHSISIRNQGIDYLCEAKLIIGCKQWDLGNSSRNKYKVKFENIFGSLPRSSEVLLTIGEIDCRLDSGIIKHKNKFPEKDINSLISTTVERFLAYVHRVNSNYKHSIIVQGVPCTNVSEHEFKHTDLIQLVKVIDLFNCELKSRSKTKGFGFLDVHKLTDRGDGFSNSTWHIDDIHLSPDGVIEAWRRYEAEG